MSVLRDFPDLPPIWMLGHGAAAWMAAELLPLIDFRNGLNETLGFGLAILGVSLAVWASLWFWRKRTSIEPREEPDALIVEGPFRINRNPIYSGMAVILLGWSLWLGALSAWLAVIPFPWIIERRFVLGEEAALRASFGPRAEAYMAETSRW